MKHGSGEFRAPWRGPRLDLLHLPGASAGVPRRAERALRRILVPHEVRGHLGCGAEPEGVLGRPGHAAAVARQRAAADPARHRRARPAAIPPDAAAGVRAGQDRAPRAARTRGGRAADRRLRRRGGVRRQPVVRAHLAHGRLRRDGRTAERGLRPLPGVGRAHHVRADGEPGGRRRRLEGGVRLLPRASARAPRGAGARRPHRMPSRPGASTGGG